MVDGLGSVGLLLRGIDQRAERLLRRKLDERSEVGRIGVPVVDGRGVAERARDLVAHPGLAVVDARHGALGEPAVVRDEGVDEDTLDLLAHVRTVDLATVREGGLEGAPGVIG